MQEMNNWRNIISASIVIDEEIWYSSDNYNGLFRINTKTGNVRFVDCFPEESFDTKYMHRCVLKYQDLLIFSPWCSDHLHIFNLKNNSFYTVFVKRKYNESIAGMHVIGNILYLIPVYTRQPIITVNLLDYSIDKIDICDLKNGDNYCRTNADTSAKTNTIYYENRIWFSQHLSNTLYALDLFKKEIQIYSTKADSIFSLSHINDSIFINQFRKPEIITYKNQNNSVYNLKNYNQDINDFGNSYYINHIVDFAGKIIAVPGFAQDIMILNNGIFEPVLCVDDLYKNVKNMKLPMFFKSHMVNEQLWLMPYGGSNLLILDNDMKIIEKKEIFCEDKNDIDRLSNYMFSSAKKVEEGAYISLREWLKKL